MDALHAELWQKIRDYQIDRPEDLLTFTDRLARENGWSVGYARRVVEEYRRFIFLAMVAGHQVTPSEQVDEAWHLHLLYTHSYWDGLCRNVLGRPLHHVPSKGGRGEAARFREQYQQTLASYRRLFDAEPPADIWPQGESGSRKKSRYKLIDTTESWVISKPWSSLKRLNRTTTPGAALCTAPVLLALTNPLDMKGPEFLVFYPCVVGVTVLVALTLRYLLREGEDSSTGQLTPYQIACLADGVPGVVRAAIVALIDRKAVEIVKSKSGGARRGEYRLKNRRGLENGSDEIDEHILAASNTPEGCYIIDALRAAQPAAEKIHRTLQSWGLLTQRDRLLPYQLVPFLFMLAVTALGLVKIIVGVTRGKPVEFLIVIVIATMVVTGLFLKRQLRTRAGDALLNRIRQQHQPLVQQASGEQSKLSGEGLILAAALFGLPAIAAGEFASLPDAWKYRAGPEAASAGAGCGTSGCGDGGGGCGGGGCGGCGGGD